MDMTFGTATQFRSILYTGVRGRPTRYWEKDVEDWMGASVWGVGRTAEDRLAYGRSVKEATSGNV